MELAIPLVRKGEPRAGRGEALFRQVYLRLRQGILGGTFVAGDRLPSTRDMAEQLGVSRTVVLLAYDQLSAEGFVVGRGGSGTFVSDGLGGGRPGREGRAARLRLSRFGAAAADAATTVDFPTPRAKPLRYDFVFGRSGIEIFPFEMWRRILLRKSRAASVRELDYGPAAGVSALRDAICGYIRRSRAVVCDPSEVIVVNGAQQALDLIARVLVNRGDSVAVEDPQYQGTREVFRAAGARLRAVSVDDHGMNPAKLPPGANLVVVTPSHQFPTGVILPLARRLALLEWAAATNGVIVENDYDGEFSYEGRPLESLQGLDRDGRVIYVGTFSRTLFPALRIGYLIVPKSLAAAFTTAKWLTDQHSATLEQKTLAEFITSGMYERHVRRLRRRNSVRREALLEAIRDHLGDRVDVTGDGSGAHVVLWPRKRISEESVIAQASSRQVGVYRISHCYLRRPTRTGILLGYSSMNADEIREGVRRLREIL